MAGRTIRKMAFLALALFSGIVDTGTVTMGVFLDSLKQVMGKQNKDREEVSKE